MSITGDPAYWARAYSSDEDAPHHAQVGSKKRVVFDAVRNLAEVYIRNHYNVIVCGLILTSEDCGGIELLAAATRFYGHSFHDIYCDVDLTTALERSSSRDRDISAADIERWRTAARDDLENVAWPVYRLQMSRSVRDLAAVVLRVTEHTETPTT